MSERPNDGTVDLTESQLSEVEGGVLIGLLLPAVQKVREAAPRSTGMLVDGETIITGAGLGGGPHVK